MTTRQFRPSFVVGLPVGWLAVDEQQPIAVAVDPTGDVLDVVSWNRLPVPERFDWPRREVVTDGRTTWVHDRPDGPTVRIDLGPAGALTVTAGPLPERSPDLARSYSRFALSRELTGWRFSSLPIDHRWTAQAEHGDQVWSLGDGSITSCAVAGAAAAVCVRRAPKRPWTFRPDHHLVLLDGGGSTTTALRDGLDTVELSWRGPDRDAVDRALTDYLPFTIGECRQAAAAGATDLRFEVADLDGLPTIATSFRWGPDGTRFVRVDEPLDEVGRIVGFQALGIILDEDLRGSDLYHRLQSGTTAQA
jgi:hypothetical protein